MNKIFTWIVFLAFSSIPQQDIIEDHVDFFELSHVYDDEGKLVLDQVIMWDWVYDHATKSTEKKVVAWYTLKNCREVLTREEWLKKNREFGDAWVKKHGMHGFIPDYVPEFIGNSKCPRYDHARKKWIVVFAERSAIRKITANAYMETWTQFDPEVENQNLFEKSTRRGLTILRRHSWLPSF